MIRYDQELIDSNLESQKLNEQYNIKLEVFFLNLSICISNMLSQWKIYSRQYK